VQRLVTGIMQQANWQKLVPQKKLEKNWCQATFKTAALLAK